MFKLQHLTGALMVLSLAAGVVTTHAAETGTKTMPDSSIYPPSYGPPIYAPRPHYRPVYNVAPHRHYCYLPTGRCNNQHRMQN
jgi:hypothetical protein